MSLTRSILFMAVATFTVAQAHAQSPEGALYGIDCVPGTGPCFLMQIEFNGAVTEIGPLTLDQPCSQFGGGTISFTPSAIEGAAFDSNGRLWAAGDNAAHDDVEYLFRVDLFDGSVDFCQEMVLGAGLNVDDVGGLAWWDNLGHLVGLDNQDQDIAFVFDPLTLSLPNLGDDHINGKGSAAAKFPDGGNDFYALESGHQLWRLTCSSDCLGLDPFTGTFINLLSGGVADVQSMAAVPGGNLWGISLTLPTHTLVEIDETNGQVVSQINFAQNFRRLNGLSFLSDGAGVITNLQVTTATGDDITLTWNASCDSGDNEYAVYEGAIGGDFTGHTPAFCGTAGATTWTLTPATGSSYYLVVPQENSFEGSSGTRNLGTGDELRPTPLSTCGNERLAPCALPAGTPPTSTVAVSVINQSGGAHSSNTFGWSFTVGIDPIDVVEMGFWDDGGDGLLDSHDVGIWDLTTQVLLGSTTVASGTADPIDLDGWRYNSNFTPFQLNANTSYVIGTFAAAGSDNIGFLTGLDVDNITTAPEISAFLTGRFSSSASFSFPNNPITQGRYFGPNFKLVGP